MIKKQILWQNIALTLIIVVIQTIISILPSILFLRNSSQGASVLTFMVIYLLFSDFFQLVGQSSYKKGKFMSIPIYGIKIIISVILILLIIKQTALQFGLILLAYELFQLLTFSKQFFYMDSVLYSLTNAFFKGIVFNQLLTIQYPYNYDFELIQPFIFSFLIVLLITVLTQGMYTFLKRHVKFFILGIVSLIAIYFLLIHQLIGNQLNIAKFIIFIILNIGTLYFFLTSDHTKRKEVVLNLFALISLYIYYI